MRQKFNRNRVLRLCGPGDKDTVPYMKAQVALYELSNYLLGPDWYDPSGLTHPENVNVSIVCAIEQKYQGTKLKEEDIPEYMRRCGYCMLSELSIGEHFRWGKLKLMKISDHPVTSSLRKHAPNVLRLDCKHKCVLKTTAWVERIPNKES